MFRKLLDSGEAGDNVGCLLRGIDKEAVERGQVLCKPGSIKPHKKFKAEAYILTKEEGGRHTPFFTNYRPQFYFRTTDVTGVVALPEGTEMVMPGDNVAVTIELITPIAMEEKLRFAIREGGRTVGAGVVTSDHRVDGQSEGRSASRALLGFSGKGTIDAKPEHKNTAQGLRSSRARCVDARDRQHGEAHGRRGARADPAADAHRALHGQPLAAHRQEEPRAVRDAHAQAAARHRRSRRRRRSTR